MPTGLRLEIGLGAARWIRWWQPTTDGGEQRVLLAFGARHAVCRVPVCHRLHTAILAHL